MTIGPRVSIPQPHAQWGIPTALQIRDLQAYIAKGGPMSIYGDEGIYEKLEAELARIYNVPYWILTNTGTSALNSGYFGLGIERGDEVIVPSYTFLATVTPLLRLGAKIVFCDADAATGNLSARDLERKLSSRTRAVAITHMWGVPCDMDSLIAVIKSSGVKLLEDCSHAHFTRYNGRLLGTYGHVSCFSIGAKKVMTSGEGGFLLTSDPEIYIRATMLGHFVRRSEQAIERVRRDGWNDIAERYSSYSIGFGENYRMHPYSAVMAFSLLETGEIYRMISNRRASLKYFESALQSVQGIEPPRVDDNYYSGAMYGFKAVISSAHSREDLLQIITALRDRNVSIKLPDTGTLHREVIFGVQSDEEFPGAVEYLRGRVSLPTFSEGLPLDKKVIDEYAEVLNYVLAVT